MPAGTSQTWERRRLNEEIEEAYILAAKAATNIEMKITFGKGAIIGDSQDFFTYFGLLLRLTSQLKEMESPKEGSDIDKLKTKIENWKRRKLAASATSREIEIHLIEGVAIFDEYYKMLMHVGIISLPTKKG